MDNCAAIGDSRSDLPLFGDLGLAVAFNGDEKAKAVADAKLSGGDLRVILPTLAAWLIEHRARAVS
jgi:phosphoserine phosphatase